MGSDMVVALKEASANGTTLFGLNHHAAANVRHAVQTVSGCMHDPGESSQLSTLELPQARQTYAVLGLQPLGQWGFTHGVNEHRVTIGVTHWQSRLKGAPAALSGLDLVRLALERSHGAHHAVEILTDLLERHGHYQIDGAAEGTSNHIFLIADASEAFVLETAGRYWAMLECGHTRVVTDAAMIRQDWRRLAPGLSDFVTAKGWWNDDGSKIDFVRCLNESPEQAVHAHKRWGHASLALAQQQGAIDLHFLRRMLADQYTQSRDLLPTVQTREAPGMWETRKPATLASTFLIDLHASDQPIVAWVAFGTPKIALHFPLCLAGELPAAFGECSTIQEHTLDLQTLAKGKDRAKLATALERLQTKFDQDADDFVLRAHDYVQHGKPYLVSQIATEMMHSHVELFDKEYRRLLGIEEAAPHQAPVVEEAMYYA